MSDLGRRGMPLHTGVHKGLEDEANEILRQHLSGITRHADKADILTPWKETSRRSREVYVASGTPDPAVRRGTFTRAWNSSSAHLNSVEGMRPPKQEGLSDQHDHVTKSSGNFAGSSLWDSE